ncbi:protein CURVATURE THYLAKOID 1D, chloroplastic [Sesamum alatum]|uniref:Protein CURVATURE THYLAKOID 1D, chloroplastic n=1 Tax=Sesamum alatum TaxID=300844 RepID=A0AAE1XSE2_9LAMI|nr:protein CURVATURE THYLAKOID 1D, chloroplastic [Sesamum alatum]
MELYAVRGTSNPPLIKPKYVASKHIQSLLYCKREIPFIIKQNRFESGLRYHVNSFLRSTTSEETSSEATPHDTDEPEPDPVITGEDTSPDEKKEYFGSQLNEASEEGFDNSFQFFKFFEDLDIKFDYEEAYTIFVYGGGGTVALWLAAAIVGAIDSIPVLPKVLELLGLGYTLWFTSRYLIFKQNRDELLARIEQIKQQVLGSNVD